MSDKLNLAEIEARAKRTERRLIEAGLDHSITDDILALLADRARIAMQLEAAQAALRDAIASSTANGEERDAAVAQLETARGLLMDCWHQLDGDVYVLPGGAVHPGAVTTIHALHAFLWPEGKTI